MDRGLSTVCMLVKAKLAIFVGQTLLLEETYGDWKQAARSKPFPMKVTKIGRVWVTLDLHRPSSPYRFLKNQAPEPGEPLMLNTEARFIPQGRLWLSQEDYDRWPGAMLSENGASTIVDTPATAPLRRDTVPSLSLSVGTEDGAANTVPMVDIDALLGRKFRLERDLRGWSLAEVARRSGVSKAMISKIERNQASATIPLLLRLASAFDLTLAGLFLQLEEQSNP